MLSLSCLSAAVALGAVLGGVVVTVVLVYPALREWYKSFMTLDDSGDNL